MVDPLRRRYGSKSPPVNMKTCVFSNVRKHREIKDSEKYITLDIYLKFGSLEKMKITSSEPKYYFGRPGKGLITSLGLKTVGRPNKNKKSRYTITNVSLKDNSKIIKEFEKLPYKGYMRKRPKHEPDDSYFYLAIQIAKCIMRADDLNSHIESLRTEITSTQRITISIFFFRQERIKRGNRGKKLIASLFYGR